MRVSLTALPESRPPGSAYHELIVAEAALQAYWQLEETAGTTADDAHSTNDGTYTGGYTLAQVGQVGKAVAFNGSTGYIDCGNVLNITGSGLTLEAWVYPTTSSGFHQIVGRTLDTSGGGRQYGIYLAPVSTGTGPDLGFETANSSLSDRDDTRKPTNMPLNAWSHVCCTFDGTTKTWYVNGSSIGTATWSQSVGGLSGSNTRTFIGALNNNLTPVSYFQGRLDEVAVYNDDLSGATVLAHYNAGL